jgi:para-aminobenzoate synthetase component 1
MNWRHQQSHAWVPPLEVAAAYADADMALLYSSRTEATTGNYSFLLLEPLQCMNGASWNDLPAIPADATANLPYYVGYLGYGMREQVARGEPSIIDLPDFQLIRYGRLLRFDHAAQVIDEFVMGDVAQAPSSRALARRSILATQKEDGLPRRPQKPPRNDEATNAPTIKTNSLDSNFTRASYESTVAQTIEHIHAGDFYQANITRKFYGEFETTPDYFSLFARLCELSPAPYSAYIRHGHTAIISSSPECFLSIDAAGVITSRPIKGSAARHADGVMDAQVREALAASPKNLAENLMIVDLMRHDLAQVSDVGSVRVREQSRLYSYQTIHHLVSTVTAQKLSDISSYDIARACFAPGSMTGAPKIAAMQWCAAQERIERGVYSGALGWFGGGNTCDLSVVIRTLICQGHRFEFQVGGGIVADSIPADEWRETLVKARAIAHLLDIQTADMEC